MPKDSQKKAPRAARVVRYKLADGTPVEKRYAPWTHPATTPTGKTLQDLIAAYERSPRWRGLAEATKRTKAHYMKDLREFQNIPVRDITRGTILDIRDLILDGRGSGAAKDFASLVGSMWAWAEERGDWLDANPMRRMGQEISLGEIEPWTLADYDRAMDLFPERLRRAVVLARWTAQRSSDLRKMLWTDYDGRHITLRQKKTKLDLKIPVLPPLRAELEAWMKDSNVVGIRGANAPPGTILTTDSGKPWLGGNLASQITIYVRKHRMPDHLCLHGLRSMACTLLANAGCSPHEIMGFSGHTTVSMVQHYTRKADQLANAVSGGEKLLALLGRTGS